MRVRQSKVYVDKRCKKMENKGECYCPSFAICVKRNLSGQIVHSKCGTPVFFVEDVVLVVVGTVGSGESKVPMAYCPFCEDRVPTRIEASNGDFRVITWRSLTKEERNGRGTGEADR